MASPQRLTAATALLVGVTGLGIVRARRAMRDLYPEPLGAETGEQVEPAHDPRLPTAAVLLDHTGTEVSDFLLPYELLAASGAFNVHATAPESRPAVLTGGLDVLPDASYAHFDRLPIERADLVVVPHMPNPDASVVAWIRAQAKAGATILSICTGAGVAAAAGVFDGRSATAHWGDLAEFERRYPRVGWLRGVRFVDGGDVAASAGITSGIDATLCIIRRLAGGDAMLRAARVIGYSDLRYLDDPSVEQYRPALRDIAVLVAAAFNRRRDIGVLLRDGVDETALAAAMDTYGAAFTARLRTVSHCGEPIRTRHGLTVLPRGRVESMGTSRLLAPVAGEGQPDAAGATALPNSGPPYAAIGQALDDLARQAGRPIARFAAKRLEYRSVVALALVISVALLPGVASAASTSAPSVRTDDSARIDAWVRDRMAARGLPGTAVAVVRDGEVEHLAGYGTAGDAGRAVTPDTPFIIGSASKPFTAVVVGQLVEEGLLSWDEPVWPHLSDLVEEAPEGFERTTVEQLLTHTGGLGMFVGTAGTVTIHEGPGALDRRVDEVLSEPLAGEPGGSFAYSNGGFMLLAAVVEQVTGRSFADELRGRVFDPLGMTGSFATADDPRAADMATGHQQWFGRWRPVELPYDEAGVAMGYVASTAGDLARFMQAHLQGHPAIPTTAAEISTGTVTPTGWTTTLDAGYGHGWFVDDIAGTRVVSHPGSLGHFTGHVLLAPEDGVGVAVVTNASSFLAGHEAQYDIGLGLIHTLLGEDPVFAEPSLLMELVVPVVAWLLVALLIGAFVRSMIRPRAHGLRVTAAGGARGWMRAVLPGVALMAVGGGLFAAPLGLARHFYPDGGWAVTVGACITVICGVVRLATGIAGGLRARSSARGPDAPAAGGAAAPEPVGPRR